MKKKSFQTAKHSRVCTDYLKKDSFKQNLSARNSLGSAFKPRRLDLKKDTVPTIFNFKIGIGGLQPISSGTDNNGKMYKCW